MMDKENKILAEYDRMETALYQIRSWANAYPVDVFPEPDFKKANEVLKANGINLAAISAANMRHVIEGVKSIVESGLKKDED